MKNIVITGATGVICREFAKALAKRGHTVAMIARHKEALLALKEEICKAGGRAFCYIADVTDAQQMKNVHDEISNEIGRCDILINGAGGNHPCATTQTESFDPNAAPDELNFVNLSQEGFSHVFDINLWGTVLPCQVFVPDMVGRDGCCILNISSMAAFSPLTKTPAYCAAKAGISNFTQWLAVHLATSKIRVNAIAPGFFLTNQNRVLLTNEDGSLTPRAKKILCGTPMGRFGKAEELVGAVEFLLDEQKSGFITGCVLPIDGGFSAYSGV